MTLDQALEAFRKNPSYDSAVIFNKTISEYRKEGMIEKDTFNKYFEEVAMYLLITDPIITWKIGI